MDPILLPLFKREKTRGIVKQICIFLMEIMILNSGGSPADR